MTIINTFIEARKYQFNIEYFCDYCGNPNIERASHFEKKTRHYCSTDCYARDRKENWTPDMQPTWAGGVSNTEAHRRWKAKNPERMAHLKARRYAREKGSDGSHTLEEWQELCNQNDYKCSGCGEEKLLTKDHIIPLSKGGSDYISNIQQLCRNCNSKKWNHIYENPELLTTNTKDTK